MNNDKSCGVALYRERNYATYIPKSATSNATETQPISLKALAMQVLERNQRNQTRNSGATSQLRYHQDSATQKNDDATDGKIELKRQKLSLLMNRVSTYYGGDESAFLDKCVTETINMHGLDNAFTYFQSLHDNLYCK